MKDEQVEYPYPSFQNWWVENIKGYVLVFYKGKGGIDRGR
jgi:hypothetical protein